MDGTEVKLEDIWAQEQSILDAIDKVCRENDLRYSLAYGTLLGAVRHGGFIPWDDDIDIMMPREDYEKLKEIWADVAPEGYLLQDDDKHPDLMNNFIKIRKDNTTFLQFESERTSSYHTGFFVDIFPCDRVAPGKLRRKLQHFLFAICLLYNRGYTSGSDGIVELAEKLLLKIVRRKNYRCLSIWAGRRSRRWNSHTECEFVAPNSIRDCRLLLPRDIFENIQSIEFNGKRYRAIKDTDKILRIKYGDYMQLPPEEERVWKHHPLVVDFGHNYEDLTEER